MIEGLILLSELILFFKLLIRFKKNNKINDLGIFSYKKE